MTPSIQSAADADENDGARCLTAADAVLKAAPADAALLSFFSALFRNATPEDVTRYAPEDLAALTRMVFARIDQHSANESIVQLFTPREEMPGPPEATPECLVAMR